MEPRLNAGLILRAQSNHFCPVPDTICSVQDEKLLYSPKIRKIAISVILYRIFTKITSFRRFPVDLRCFENGYVQGVNWRVKCAKIVHFQTCIVLDNCRSILASGQHKPHDWLGSLYRTWAHVLVRYMLSPVRLPSTQPVEIFGNISTPFGTSAIRW